MALTTPEVFTVASELLLLQVPPVVVVLKLVVKPAQTISVPVIPAGTALTVIVTEAEQPVASISVIVAVPGVTPRTIPVDDPIFTLLLLALHTPPDGVVFKVVDKPTQIASIPVIAAGFGLTVKVVVFIQPVLSA
jgi:hypothetical protein